MDKSRKKRALCIFTITIIVIAVVLSVSILKTAAYNNKIHSKDFSGSELFSDEGATTEGILLKASTRSSTWSKAFDMDDEGITEHNFQAYTYDFSVGNKTKDEVSSFSFKLVFNQNVFLSSAWNGAVEIHQTVNGEKHEATIPDLREYKTDDYDLNFFTVDGENFIPMESGDYIVYYPSTDANAMEMPIKPMEGTTPGFIIYVPMGESLEGAELVLDYSFHRLITSEPIFWISIVAMIVWLMAVIVFAITSIQIRKYNERHERDNEIISESIETFTGFIDAKDPYTNGHSKRVAMYTKAIAKELGFEGEELDRIFYIALLHDCGKIGVPDNVLGKPGKLTDEEFEIIKSHTVRGGEILASFKSIDCVGEGAIYHHERFDGKGYPEGKSGEDIPLIARMICVADSYDAMNTDRVYRKKLPQEQIIEEIEKNKGHQFDPEIADIMLRLIREDKLPLEDKE